MRHQNRNRAVQFIASDDSENEPYCASEDAAAEYSGTDDDAPLARSPHRLRSKESKRKTEKQKGTLLQTSASALSNRS